MIAVSVPPANRRGVLRGGVALVVGFMLPLASRHAAAQRAGTPQASFNPAQNQANGSVFAPNGFIRVASEGTITFIAPQIEMGQGVYTGEAMLIAEELEVGLDQLSLVAAPPDEKLYAEQLLQMQATGGSTSIRGGWTPLREAGAVARTMLIDAAARRWGVPPQSCRASRAVVTHSPTGRTLPYAALAEAAQQLPIPTEVALKDPSEFTLIGKSSPRLDIPAKTNGSARFGIDVVIPGVKIATVSASPVFGGRLARVDDSAALKTPGVFQVVKLDDAVAVIADNMWAAISGLRALNVDWSPGRNAHLTTEQIFAELQAAAQRGDGVIARKSDGFDTAYRHAARRVEAVYHHPFLAHAALEPINALIHVQPDRCDVWCGTQVPVRAQAQAAQATGLPIGKVFVHNQYIGGAFGRRLSADFIGQAAAIAKQVNAPVKVIWTREEDIQHDTYRPPYLHVISAGLDTNGAPIAYRHRVVGASCTAAFDPQGLESNGLDPDCVEGAEAPPYDFPTQFVDWVRQDPPPGVPFLWWRGVGPTHNVFTVESFMDELAHAAGQDPVAYRQALLRNNPRARSALELAAEKSGWGSPLPPRTGRGVSLQNSFGSYVAAVVEAAVTDEGEVILRRADVAVDCGIAVNPDCVAAQIEGGLIFGWTAALFGAITIKDGRVEQSNFNNYRMLRIDETPPIRVHIVPSAQSPGGIGETATVASQASLCNAIFAATGVRIRSLPIDRKLLGVKT